MSPLSRKGRRVVSGCEVNWIFHQASRLGGEGKRRFQKGDEKNWDAGVSKFKEGWMPKQCGLI
jgi:hypothetical protein